jgi:hypothetical protein
MNGYQIEFITCKEQKNEARASTIADCWQQEEVSSQDIFQVGGDIKYCQLM